MARPPQTVGNMVRSMVVVVIGTALIVIATLFKGGSSPSIDYLPTWSAAQRQITSFTPLAPTKAPDGWRAVSVNATATTWHLGFTTADGHYAGIEQGEEFMTWIKGAKEDGQWNGWQRWSSPQWRALSTSQAVVCGDASFAELEILAKSLRG